MPRIALELTGFRVEPPRSGRRGPRERASRSGPRGGALARIRCGRRPRALGERPTTPSAFDRWVSGGHTGCRPHGTQSVRNGLLGAALSLLASCGSFSFESQRLALRAHPDADAVEVLIVSEGVVADGERPHDLQRAVAALGAIVDGRRRFVLLGWPFEIDLDDADLPEDVPEIAARVAAYASGVRVLGAGLERDGDRLVLHQHLRLERAGEAFALLNDGWNELLLEIDRTGDLADDLGHAMAARWVARARQGHAWVSLGDEGLALHVPASPADAAWLLRGWTRGQAAAVERGVDLGRALETLGAVELAGDVLTLRFPPDEDGVVDLKLPLRPARSGADLVAALLEAGVDLHESGAAADARRALAAD